MSGKTGYEAYARCTDGKTYDGRDMPAWDELPGRIQGAWSEAAAAIAREVYAAVEAANVEDCPETQPAPDGYPGR